MVTEMIRELSAAKARAIKLEKSIASGLQKELARLPARYGFTELGVFIAEVRGAVEGTKGRPGKSPKAKVRKRAKITDVTRAKVRKMVGAGKSGSAIAKALGISLPSVQNIKKALGLVRGSKKPAPKGKAARVKVPKPAQRTSSSKAKKKSAAKKAVVPVSTPAPEPAPTPSV
jgi:hypothetical protein